MVSLDTMKTAKGLEEMVVVKRGRLSVQPVTAKEFEIVKRLANT
jgi:predicted RNA-binding protein with PUA-like domain